ncbi:S24 family peptidase [Serratia marcescens]|uniref:S24 family peptidase n=1 Tax=Serratia marcescens TaxID=615 RepID=UPI0007C96ADC|nr:S24 family peptidase [Serratia marcescens]OAH29141.1 phage repressor protein [Serratia marcescens]
MNNETDILERNIKHLMDKSGVSNTTELSRRLRMNQPTLHRLLSGEVKDPKYGVLKQIADFFKIEVKDLVETDMAAGGEYSTAGTIELAFAKVPVVGGAQLGEGVVWADLQYPVGQGDGFLRWPTKDPNAYALRCAGDSMTPRIKEGEFVVVEPSHSYSPGDEVLLVTDQEEAMVKTFLYTRDGYVHLSSINEAHPPIKLEVPKIAKIHYVAGVAKSALWSQE